VPCRARALPRPPALRRRNPVTSPAPHSPRVPARPPAPQAVDEFVGGNIPVEKPDEVGRLVAHAMAVDLGEDMPSDVDDLVAVDLMEYVPASWRSKKAPRDWAALVLKHRASCLEVEPEAVQARFVQAVKDHPLYGTCFFHVRKHRFPTQMDAFPAHCVIALNSEGLHFLGADERDTLASFGYADIYRWGGSSTQFSIIIWNAASEDTDDVSMFTCQAADMAALILDYINVSRWWLWRGRARGGGWAACRPLAPEPRAALPPPAAHPHPCAPLPPVYDCRRS